MYIGLEMGDEHKIGSNEGEKELPRRGRRNLKRLAKKQVYDSDDSEQLYFLLNRTKKGA
jgi:hypothetical protein